MPKKAEVDTRTKLKAKLEAKRIARMGLDKAYDNFDELKKTRKRLKKENKDVSVLEIKIDTLKEELTRLEEAADNMQCGGDIQGGIGFGSGGGCGTDAAGH